MFSFYIKTTNTLMSYDDLQNRCIEKLYIFVLLFLGEIACQIQLFFTGFAGLALLHTIASVDICAVFIF